MGGLADIRRRMGSGVSDWPVVCLSSSIRSMLESKMGHIEVHQTVWDSALSQKQRPPTFV